MGEMNFPLVSCIMPTYNRRHFIPRAIRCFQTQDYPNLELIIVDDGTDPIADVLPDDPRILRWYFSEKQPLGTKRNFACTQARGDYIVHWDDDDWYPSSRVSRQITALRSSQARICGSSTIYYYQTVTGQAFRYQCPTSPATWLGPIAYEKALWKENPFPPVQVAEDVNFLLRVPPDKLADLKDPSLCVASIHACNASPKRAFGKCWLSESPARIRELLPPDDELRPRNTRTRFGDRTLASPGILASEARGAPARKTTGVQRNYGASKGATSAEDKLMNEQEETTNLSKGLSAVVCHGGLARLPHLTASLANMRQSQGIDEVIVVEMGTRPYAEDAARRWADKYFFVYNEDAFERARSLNIGTALAERDLVLWRDNDLIMPTDFIETAVAEMRAGDFDFMVPYGCVNYLSASDSQEVMRGTKPPADCKPVGVLRAGQIHGAVGIVKKSFVSRYGGMSEEFRGWGGEDDAWWSKACLLGRASGTQRSAQHIYHLFHSNSGGYGGNAHITSNPHYARNLAVLREISATRDRHEFLRQFPPNLIPSCNWEGKQVTFIFDGANRTAELRASELMQALKNLFGEQTGWSTANISDSAWRERLFGRLPDCVVLVGSTAAEEFLADSSWQEAWKKSIVELSADEVPMESAELLQRAGTVCSCNPNMAHMLQSAGLKPWSCSHVANGSHLSQNAAQALLQPLSLLLGNASLGDTETTLGARPAQGVSESSPDPMQLPVWMYWEGECPEWIRHCQQTVFAHADNVRLISAAEFDRLRENDRHISLARLDVVHRSDYIRSYLLAHYGGLWIDSDCLVMQSLQSVLDRLRDFDFVAHRERRGVFSNDFMAARRGSQIAAALYCRVCEIMRSRRPLGWTALGSEPLTSVLTNTNAPWYEIACELIQPICWSNPGAFFAINDRNEHERLYSSRALCFMLSNVTLKRYQAANPSKDLLGENTFFRYLLGKALDNNQSTAVKPEKARGSDSKAQALPFCIEAVVDVVPKRVLDIGVGLGRWGVLVREFCEKADANLDPGHRRVHIEGIQTSLRSVGEPHYFLYDRVKAANGDVSEWMGDSWNVAILDDTLDGWPKQIGTAVLDRALEIADYVLVHNRIVSESDAASANGHSHWKLSDFLAFEPIRHKVFNGHSNNRHAALLFSRRDPRHLKASTSIETVFARILQEYSQAGEESISGPGSSILHTTQIRERLPLLIEDIGVRSLLDAPCGDFHWMRHVKLGLREYIGVDVLSPLVARNQQNFGGPHRRFLKLDLTNDALPTVDLILCRDCLVHFSYEDVFRALRTFKQSGSKYMLATTFVRVASNKEIATGGWRPLNLQLPPFNFPRPLRIIDEKCTENGGQYADKSLGLWRIDDLLQ
jgi:glycosyltransferase involved in cell wall biosynthesis